MSALKPLAREGRYRIFAKLEADYVVLAQHLDDQAETLLLQLLRGAGVKGLGAMPVVRNLPAGRKPEPAQEIDKSTQPDEGPKITAAIARCIAARDRRLCPENMDCSGSPMKAMMTSLSTGISCAMNFFPCWKNVSLPIAAHFCGQAVIWRRHPILLDELAEADSRECAVSGKLHIEDLRKLSFPRARNLLRYTLAQRGAILPSTAKLDEILRQLAVLAPGCKNACGFRKYRNSLLQGSGSRG